MYGQGAHVSHSVLVNGDFSALATLQYKIAQQP
jgi:hypothetical protein